MNELAQFQEWYLSQCNGDWEHQNGVSIETLDNPGWSVEIDLVETKLETKSFIPIEKGVVADSVDDSPDWLCCKVENKKFVAICGPLHLATVIGIFLKWTNDGLKQ